MESTSDFLEVWLSSPKYWKGKKLCEFWVQTHNFIKEKPNLDYFKTEIDSIPNASQWDLWNGKQNWSEVLGDHFDIVTSYAGTEGANKKKSKKNFDTLSVLELLRIIRNKHQHNDHYKNYNGKLKWFNDNGEELQFDDELYGKYWNDRFPNLGLYLWTRFWQLKEKVSPQFYPANVFNCSESLTPKSTLKDLQSGFETQKNQGYLYGRFKLESVNVQVEFRTLPEQQIMSVLNGSEAMLVVPLKDQNICAWYAKSSPTLCVAHSADSCFYQTIIIVTNAVRYVTGDALSEALNPCKQDKGIAKRIIILFNREYEGNAEVSHNIDKFMDDISRLICSSAQNTPITWPELTHETKEKVVGSIKVRVQQRVVLLSNLFPNENNTIHELLSKLSATHLNQVLRGNTINVLEKMAIPKLPEIYIERNIGWEKVKLQIQGSKDRFVICSQHLSEKEISDLVDCQLDDVKIIRKFREIYDSSERYLLYDNELNTKILWRAMSMHTLNPKPEDTHYLFHAYENVFSIMHYFSTNDTFKGQDYVRVSKETLVLSESAYVDSLLDYRRNERLVFIAGECGMGKSMILHSAAHKLIKKHTNVLAILTDFNQFLTIFKQEDLSHLNIDTTICKLVSSNSFEEHLTCELLKNKIYRVELMLDALDEVPLHLQSQAIAALEILSANLNLSRIWVTVRKHMLDKLPEKFKTFSYNILPFSESDQIEFLLKTWQSNSLLESKLGTEYNLIQLRNFATNVLKGRTALSETNISGVPLQCQMLAEIYLKFLLEGNLQLKDFKWDLLQMYNLLLLRKLDVYLKEKNRVQISPQNSLFRIIKQNFKNSLVYYSLKLLVSYNIADAFRSPLLSGFATLSEADSYALEMGVTSNLNPLTFAHCTYAEFVLAEFAFKGITNQRHNLDGYDEKFKHLVWRFIFDTQISSLENNIPDIQFKHPGVCNFLNKFLKRYYQDKRAESTIIKRFRLKIYSDLDNFRNYFVKVCPRFIAAITSRYHYIFYFLFTERFETLCLIMAALAGCNIKIVQNLAQLLRACKSTNSAILDTLKNQQNSDLHQTLSDKFLSYLNRSLNVFKEVKHITEVLVNSLPSVLEDRNGDDETILLYLTKSYSNMSTNFRPDHVTRSSYQWFLNLLVQLGAKTCIKNKDGQTVYELAVTNKLGDFLLINISSFKDYFMSTDKVSACFIGNTLLHTIISAVCRCTTKSCTSEENELYKLNNGDIQETACFIKFAVSTYPCLLEEKDKNGRTPLHHFVFLLGYMEINTFATHVILNTLVTDLKANVNDLNNTGLGMLNQILTQPEL